MLSPNCSMILVKQLVKGSKIVEYLKTEAGYRIVALCPETAEYLRKFVGDRKGSLFPSRKRTSPVSYRNFLKRHLTPSMKNLVSRSRERRLTLSVVSDPRFSPSQESKRTFGSSGLGMRTTTSRRNMRNRYARTTFGDRP